MNRTIRNNQISTPIYPQPYIDPMVYLNPYYSSQNEYQYTPQDYIDYNQFTDNLMDENYTLEEGLEYTNIAPEEDFNIPCIPYYPPNNLPQMILPGPNYQGLPQSMNMPQNTNMPQNMNMPQMQMPMQKPMYPANMYPNMYPQSMPQYVYPNMLPPNMFPPNMQPYWGMNPEMSNINIEEFDEEEM